MKTIIYSQYGGIDWHDSNETSEMLEENGTFSISSPDEVIAEHLYKKITEMHCDTTEKGVLTRSVRLENIPTYADILAAVVKGEKISLASEAEEIGLTYNPETKSVNFYYGFGQIDYHGKYIITDIPDDKAWYFVTENFLAPAKGVPSIIRLYNEPYETEAEARKAFKELKLHDGYNSVAEIIVVNREGGYNEEWYELNMQLVELMRKYPDVPFSCFAKRHLENFQVA